MASSRFPLPLRNALAELAIAALDDDAALRALSWLAAPDGPPPAAAAARLTAAHLIDPGGDALLDVHAPHGESVRAHARRALEAGWAYRRNAPPSPDLLTRGMHQAAALWRERLFFEVHEVLEALWKTQVGEVRQALQGVIQIAVAFHHFAHGNLRGARSLLGEGRMRVTGAATALPALDASALLAMTAPWEAALTTGTDPPAEPPPLPLTNPRR
jgi:hypothetical protein